MSHVFPPQSSLVVSSHPDEELFPTISFHCSCGKRLYKMSANVVALRGQLKCERCGKHYVLLDSPIALAVSSARVAKALIENLGPYQSPGGNANIADLLASVAPFSPTRK
jgi:hypothetical protein